MPLVSVITAAYNAERYLAQTLASIQAQSMADFEMIVVDDGSTDATVDLVREAAARDPRIRVVCQANQRASAARNRGLAEARGTYACSLDADDLYAPDKLKRQLQALGGREDAFCLTGVRRFADSDGHREWLHSTKQLPLGPDYFERLLALGSGHMVNGNTLLAPVAALRAVGGWKTDQHTAEDWELWIRLARRFTVLNVDDDLVFYRKHLASVTRSQSVLETMQAHVRIIEEHAAGLGVTAGALRRLVALRYREHGATLAARRDFSEAAACLLTAARRERIPSSATLMAAARLVKARLLG